MNTLPINPDLPYDFFNTDEDNRSEEEIRTWWDRPFAVTTDDGKFDVQCLCGGAWDRPSYWGRADTIEAATVLAERKLKEWQTTRARPSLRIDCGIIQVIRMPQSPMEDITVLAAFDAMEKAKEYIDSLEQHS